jgi:hypothetical protein
MENTMSNTTNSEKRQVATINPNGLGTMARMNGRNMGQTKEQIDGYTLVVCIDEQIVAPVDVRIYMGRSASASVVYASVWLRYENIQCSGHGKAGGHGYHKASAAVSAALASAGVKLSVDIDGCGDSAIVEAIEAVGVAMGFDGCPMRVI